MDGEVSGKAMILSRSRVARRLIVLFVVAAAVVLTIAFAFALLSSTFEVFDLALLATPPFRLLMVTVVLLVLLVK